MNNINMGNILLKLTSIIFFGFSLLLFYKKKLILTSISFALLSCYLGFVSLKKLKKSNLIYMSIMTCLSFSLAYEKGVNIALFITLAIVFTAMYYIHYVMDN
jgi:hypothetical protein